MKKREIEKEVFHTSVDDPISIGEIKELAFETNVTILDTDIMIQCQDDEYYRYDISILRTRMETNEEFEVRKKREENSSNHRKEARRRNYLMLKEEFENE